MIPNLLENDEDSKKKKKERKREGRKKNRTDNEIVGNAAKLGLSLLPRDGLSFRKDARIALSRAAFNSRR